jgi:uncharacterized lipoprotein
MRKAAIAAAVVLMVGGCAHAPQVNRAAKADKYAAPKTKTAEMPTPNQVIKKRWFPKYKIKWLHK